MLASHLRACCLTSLCVKAPRSLAKGLLKKLKAHEESLILGENFAEVLEVPEVVNTFVTQQRNVVCMFDQNMHWPEGSILGTQLCKQLRGQGFVGLVIIRSANDRYSVLCCFGV